MKRLLAVVLLVAGASAFAGDDKLNPAAPPGYPDKSTAEASIYRGSIVFHHYCQLCHGVKADGNGRAAKLYNPRPANLVMSDKNNAYKNLIIRQGGKTLGRSEFMPPWGNELTDEQITDVVAFLGSIRAPGVEVK
jgi:mono/diheme cytochrome c family protein